MTDRIPPRPHPGRGGYRDKEAMKAQAISLLQEGHSTAEAQLLLGVGSAWISNEGRKDLVFKAAVQEARQR